MMHSRQHKSNQVAQELIFDAQPAWHPLRKTGHRQSGKQHHRALREIENA
jgi:hypothetical protein